MIAFVVRRTLLAMAILLLASVLVFIATQLLPGNAAIAILGKAATPERVRALEQQLGLNQPPAEQYWQWISGIFSGNLGVSVSSGTPVSEVIAGRLVNTGFLLALSGILGISAGILVGIVAATWRNKWPDNVLSTFMVGLAAIPDFLIGLILVIILGSVVWQVLPSTADIAPGQGPWHDLPGIALPVLTLALAVAPYTARITRATMVDALGSEYVEFAVLRGVSRRRVILAHALPNSFGPIAQAAAISLAYLAGGTVLVEYIFAYPGTGQGFVYAVQSRDVPVIQLIALILAGVYVSLNLVADIVTILLNPRTRTGEV